MRHLFRIALIVNLQMSFCFYTFASFPNLIFKMIMAPQWRQSSSIVVALVVVLVVVE